MKLKTIAALLGLVSGSLYGAPAKVVLLGDNQDLRQAIIESGAQLVEGSAANQAEVLVVQKSGVDRSMVESFAKRGLGIVFVGKAIESGEWLKPLVGASWTPNSRKFESLMMLYPLTDAHGITKGASSFDLNDATSYDLDLEPGIQVLGSAFSPKVTSAKKDNRAPEKLDRANVYDVQPQMWAYEAPDNHRAFVLLQGGSESLKHASIQTFLLRGISWAAKHENIEELTGKQDLAKLRYPAGGPRTAEETAKSFELMPGFKATAIASEPLINKPIAMQFDGKGRLWIAETPEYPNGRRPAIDSAWKETGVLKPDNYDRPATDRISILSEPDADGRFTKKTVYYTGLELVTGFCLYKDGIIAVNQPDIVYVHGEGSEQKVERLYTGFSPGDTHFVANHFMMSPDGWIYANTGSGPTATSVLFPEVTAKLTSGVFRFKPDGSAIEQVGSKGGNAFGMDLTSEGEILFGQATSGNPVQHIVLPEWILSKGKVGKAGSVESVIAGRKVVRPDMPTRVPYMQIDAVGGYSSACASTVYEGGAWPSEWNRTVFCTEPILDIIHCEKLKPAAPNILSEMTVPDREWLRARDFWFFPVDVQFGPDGAMYVLDFYNPIVAHSDSRGPKHSRSGATVRPDREHYFGRIYRIQHNDAKKLETLDLTTLNPAGLVKAFSHPNKGVRFNAQRLLMERSNGEEAGSILQEVAKSEASPEARILALWSLARFGRLESSLLLSALQSKDSDVRKAALLIVESLGAANTTDFSPSLNDPDSRVQLLALRAMSAVPLSKESAGLLLSLLPKLTDDWSKSAATAASSSNAGPMLEAALALNEEPSPALLELADSLTHSLSEKQDGLDLAKVIIAASNASPKLVSLVHGILEAGGSKVPNLKGSVAGLKETILSLTASGDPITSANALVFAQRWITDGSQKDTVSQKIKLFLRYVQDTAAPVASRISVINALVNVREADPEIVRTLVGMVKPDLNAAFLSELISALARSNEPMLGKNLVQIYASLPASAQNTLFDVLAMRVEWASAILDALQAKSFSPTLLGPARLSKLRLHPDAGVAKRAVGVLNEVGGGTSPGKDETIAKLLPLIESKAGDAEKGKVAFSAMCATCHRFNGNGVEVGPILDGIGVQGTNELLISIIDPSRVVDNEHRTWSLKLKDGSFAVGIIASENESTVTLHLPGGISQDIKVSNIKSREDTGLSLMPEGLEAVGADTLRDILSYLRGSNAKYRALNLGTAFTTDTNGGLYNSREAKGDTVHPVKFGVATVEGVPFSLPDPSTTATGGNVIVLKNAEGKTFAGSLPQRVEIPVGFAAGNIHFLGGVAGWGLGPDSHTPAMKVTLIYADEKRQVEELFTGDVFLDYNHGGDVPGSKRVNGVVKSHHVRYFSLPVKERGVIKTLVLESYKNGVAPTTLAITADTDAPKGAGKAESKTAASEVKIATELLPASGETLPSKAEDGVVRALLIGGGSSHDFEKFFHQADAVTLKGAGKITTAYTSNAEEAVVLMPNADVIVLSANHKSFGTPDFQKALNAFADAGHGLVIVHAGVWYNWAPLTGYNKRFVGGGSRGHGFGDFQVIQNPSAKEHAVMKDVSLEFTIHDEHYRPELDSDADVEVLAMTSVEPKSGKAYPSVWVVKDSKARIICTGLGHGLEAHSNPEYQKLLVNAVHWVATKPGNSSK